MRHLHSIGIVAVIALASGGALAACRAGAAPSPIAAAPRALTGGTAPLGPQAAAQRAPLEAVAKSALCMTEGRALAPRGAGNLRVEEGATRGFVGGDRSRSAELAFTYDGPSAVDKPLASGELRRQVGLKLRARDSCNVVYVMWHLEPTQSIAVSVKHTANATSHRECGATGYDNVKPALYATPPRIERGVAHVLDAELDGDDLLVRADGNVVWKGPLPAAARSFDGPVGFRTDNGTFDLELRIPGGKTAGGGCR